MKKEQIQQKINTLEQSPKNIILTSIANIFNIEYYELDIEENYIEIPLDLLNPGLSHDLPIAYTINNFGNIVSSSGDIITIPFFRMTYEDLVINLKKLEDVMGKKNKFSSIYCNNHGLYGLIYHRPFKLYTKFKD